MTTNYKNKYHKYKNKYLLIKKGGVPPRKKNRAPYSVEEVLKMLDRPGDDVLTRRENNQILKQYYDDTYKAKENWGKLRESIKRVDKNPRPNPQQPHPRPVPQQPHPRPVPQQPPPATPLLPAIWEMINDPRSGKTYYYNRVTGKRSWNHPNPHHHSNKTDLGKFKGIFQGSDRKVDAIIDNSQQLAVRTFERRKAGVDGLDDNTASAFEWYGNVSRERKLLEPFVKPMRVGSKIRHKWDKGYGCACPYSPSEEMILMTPLMIDYTTIMDGKYRNSGNYTCPNCKEIRNGARWVCPTPNLIGKYGEICTECCPVTTKDYRELRDIISYMMEIKMGHSKISKV